MRRLAVSRQEAHMKYRLAARKDERHTGLAHGERQQTAAIHQQQHAAKPSTTASAVQPRDPVPGLFGLASSLLPGSTSLTGNGKPAFSPSTPSSMACGTSATEYGAQPLCFTVYVLALRGETVGSSERRAQAAVAQKE